MLLDLIYGGVGVGKTELCIELIERTMKENHNHNVILTVPDQYSYTTEKRIVKKIGGMGLNGIEVLTFSQFFRRYLNKSNTYLSAPGKQMLFYKAVAEQKKEGSLFSASASKPGFINKIAELVSEMKRYMVSPQELKDFSNQKNDMLSKKLFEFSDIYAAYNKSLERGFNDADDDFARFAEFIEQSNEFKNTHIWFDGFSDFLPQHYAVIKAFLRHAQSVHVSLCLEEKKDIENSIFSVSQNTAMRLKKIAEEEGARINEQKCNNRCYTIHSPELLHLMQNWDNYRKIYNDKTENMSIFTARDLYFEIDYVARKIIEEVKAGARYRDISVFCNGIEKYSHLLEAIFEDYDIPYFTDIKIPITEHPIILTILAAFDIDADGWSYESVFRYLRSGYIYIKNDDGSIESLNPESIDLLENYVLRHGIRGKKAWLSEDTWEAHNSGVFDEILGEENSVGEDIEEINKIRFVLTGPFKRFYKRASGKRHVRELSEALYEFLCDIYLYEGIEEEALIHNEKGNRNEAEQVKQIWNYLIEVINQAVVIASDELISRENYCNMIKNGLAEASLQIIPSGLDSVSVSDSNKNSAGNTKIVFFIGAINGTMPNESHSDGILSDSDRKKAEERGLEIAKDNIKKSKQERFKLYRLVTSASKKLYFSYPVSDSEGNAMQPSGFIKNLYKMFPKICIEDNLLSNSYNIYNPKQAFIYIMHASSDKRLEANASLVTEFFKNEKSFTEMLDMVRYAREYKKRQPEISKENAIALYNNYHRYSVSRMNDYSACPFNYFIKYGLKAREQEIHRIKKFEIGSLLHYAVCEYCHEVENGNTEFFEVKKRWQELSKEESNAIVERIMEEIETRVLSVSVQERSKIKYLLGRMKKILIRSTEIVRLSLSKGEYSAVCYEEKFQIDIEWKSTCIGLNGTIDRVDAAVDEESGNLFLRVIDYKSGNKSFDVTSISNSTDMQLVVYAIAATELYKKGALGRVQSGLKSEISGILYNKLRDDRIKTSIPEPENIEIQKINQMKPDGVVIADKEEETKEAIRIDKSLTAGQKSEFMKIALNSKGDALDGRYSSVMERKKFDILVNYVKKSVIRIDNEIFDGRIDIKPLAGKSMRACRFCEYREICLYDPVMDGERKEIELKDEAWEFMENEIGKE